jgi:hypothetical protein
MGYFPNGTDGAIFEEKYCMRCTHYGLVNGEFPAGGCPVWVVHLVYNYDQLDDGQEKLKDVLSTLIPNECRMFILEDKSNVD